MSQVQLEVRPKVSRCQCLGTCPDGGAARRRVIKPLVKQEPTDQFPIKTSTA